MISRTSADGDESAKGETGGGFEKRERRDSLARAHHPRSSITE